MEDSYICMEKENTGHRSLGVIIRVGVGLEKTVTDKVTFLQPEQESLPGSSNKLLSLICLKSDSLKLIS